MDAFLFSLTTISPVILTVILGYFLKKTGLLPKEMVAPLNKLNFRVFLPAMLFLNIYNMESFQGQSYAYILLSAVTVLLVFAVSIPLTSLITERAERRGVLLQASFRSNNALIGVALAQSLCGDEGVRAAALLSAVVIPLFNVLAVLSLSLFQRDGARLDFKKLGRDILANPLIRGIALGLICVLIRSVLERIGFGFRLGQITPLMSVLKSLSSLATPLSLIVLGAQFEFSAVSEMKKELVFGTAMRTLIVPTLALGAAFLFFRDAFTAAQFAVLIAVFATPVAVSSVPMTQEMGGDVELAGQIVVWSTVASTATVFLSTLLLRMAGIFG
ncbi:MAG: AEC family transporter [Clostridia bacterium]|nr:AEC family transporter [Clostridia bacterium]